VKRTSPTPRSYYNLASAGCGLTGTAQCKTKRKAPRGTNRSGLMQGQLGSIRASSLEFARPHSQNVAPPPRMAHWAIIRAWKTTIGSETRFSKNMSLVCWSFWFSLRQLS